MLKITRANVTVCLLLLVVAGISTGCQVVNVKDKDGKAIAFANVSSGVQGSKFSSMPAYTDSFGNALLPLDTSESKKKWVAVSKEGYISRRISRPAEGTIEITLQKAGSSGRRYKSTRAVSGRGKSETVNLRSAPSSSSKVTVPRKNPPAPK